MNGPIHLKKGNLLWGIFILLTLALVNNSEAKVPKTESNKGEPPFLGRVMGAFIDPVEQEFYLIGDGDPSYPDVSMTQIATAFQWAFADSPVYNFLSIDPISSNPEERWMKIRINADAQDSEFGYIMFEADRMAKVYSLGVDNLTGLSLESKIPGYQNIFQLSQKQRAFYSKNSREKKWNRFWLYPDKNKVKADNLHFYIEEARMGLKTEPMKWEGGQLVPDPDREDPEYESFANFFTENYESFAIENKVFAQLEQIFRLLLISEWIRDYHPPLLRQFIDSRREEVYRIPRFTPTITVKSEVTKGNSVIFQTIMGGTSLEFTSNYVKQDQGQFNALKGDIKNALENKESTNFPFQYQNQNHVAKAVPEMLKSAMRSTEKIQLDVGIDLFVRDKIYANSDVVTKTSDNRELAIPRLSGYFPEGRKGEYKSTVIEGKPSSIVGIKSYQLFNKEGNFIGNFRDHRIDQIGGRLVIQPEEANSGWRLFPQGKTVFATDNQTVWIFDGESGLFLGEQNLAESSITRYNWKFYEIENQKRFTLESIQKNVGQSEEKITFQHQDNGTTIRGLHTSSGKSLDFSKITDQSSSNYGPFDVEISLAQFPDLKTVARIDPKEGKVDLPEKIYAANEVDFLNRLSQSIADLVHLPTQQNSFLLADGSFTLWFNRKNSSIKVIAHPIQKIIGNFRRRKKIPEGIPIWGVEKLPREREIVLLKDGNNFSAAITYNGEVEQHLYGAEAYDAFIRAARDYVSQAGNELTKYLHIENKVRVLDFYTKDTKFSISTREINSLISDPLVDHHPIDDYLNAQAKEVEDLVFYRSGMHRSNTREEVKFQEAYDIGKLFHAINKRMAHKNVGQGLTLYKDDDLKIAQRNLEEMEEVGSSKEFAFWVDKESYDEREQDSMAMIIQILKAGGFKQIANLNKAIEEENLMIFSGRKYDDSPDGGLREILNKPGMKNRLKRKNIYLMTHNDVPSWEHNHRTVRDFDVKSIYSFPKSFSLESLEVYVDQFSKALKETESKNAGIHPADLVRRPFNRVLGKQTGETYSQKVQSEISSMSGGGFQISYLPRKKMLTQNLLLTSC